MELTKKCPCTKCNCEGKVLPVSDKACSACARGEHAATTQQKIQALSVCIDAVKNMHGSMTGEDHTAEAVSCKCSYGTSLRIVRTMRKKLYRQISDSKKFRQVTK